MNDSFKPPITISIQAPWGQGKTSLMRMIQKRLEPDSQKPDSDSPKSTKAKFDDIFRWIKQFSKKPITGMLIQAMQKKPATKTDKVPTVWFNPLYYHNTEQIWAGLAHAILTEASIESATALRCCVISANIDTAISAGV